MSQSLADIKLIRSTATSLEWDLSGVLEPGKKYSIEVTIGNDLALGLLRIPKRFGFAVTPAFIKGYTRSLDVTSPG